MSCRVCGLDLPDVGAVGRRLRQTARLMIGVPDYETYLAHRRANHPDLPVMNKTEFFRDSQDRRYGGGTKAAFRCC